MPFHYVLANLLAETDNAVGALFLDPSGETIDLSCTAISPYQMRILGAYLGIHLRQVERLLASSGLGESKLLHFEQDDFLVHAVPLPDGYYLVLVQRPPVRLMLSQRSLLDAASQIRVEAFPKP